MKIFKEWLIIEKEIWKDINGFEGIYQVSNLGRIKSLSRTFWNSSKGGYWCNWPERILDGGLVGTFVKYKYVVLCNNNFRKKCLVHKLVFENFVQNVPKGMTIDHIDGNPLNNKLNNLQLVTHSENNAKARKSIHGKQHSYRFTDINTNEQLVFKSASEAASYFDVNATYIRDISIHKCTSNYLKGKYKVEAINLIN